MKDLFLGSGGVLTVCDAPGQSITVNGRVWYFDYDSYNGPLWLKKNGEERKCQCPTAKAVWDAFEKWVEDYERSKLK